MDYFFNKEFLQKGRAQSMNEIFYAIGSKEELRRKTLQNEFTLDLFLINEQNLST